MTTDMLEKLGTRRRERESAVEAERLAEEAKAAALKCVAYACMQPRMTAEGAQWRRKGL